MESTADGAAEAKRILGEVVEAISEAFVLYDAEDRLVLCNEKYRQFYDLSADLIVPGNSFAQIVRAGAVRGQYADAIGRIDAWVAERIRLHRNPTGAIEQRLSDGRWLRITEYKTRSGWVGGLRIDITALKRAEEAARQNEQRYRQLVERTNAITYSYKLGERNLSYVAPQASRLLGYPLGDLMSGQFWFDHMHPDDRKEVQRVGQAMASRLQEHSLEYRMIDAKGRVIWIRDIVTFDDGPDGAPMAQGIIIDITEQKRSEAARFESEQRFRYLVESTDVVPYSWDLPARRYLYVGPQAARIFGYAVEQWTDQAWWQSIVHPEDREIVTRQSEAFHARPRDESFEYRLLTADGRTVWIRDVMKLGSDASGGQIGYGVMIDVTEAKSQQEKLVRAQKIEAIGQLTGGIAHDFNNLLTVIQGNLELSLQKLAEGEARNRVARALNAAQGGGALTQRLLAFARQQALRAEAVDVNGLAAGMQDLLQRALGEDVEIRMSLQAGLWPAFADKSQIENSLLNLAINARDAMPGGGTLTVETANAPLDADCGSPDVAPGDYVLLAVTDTGTGMPPDVLARAFDPFFTTKDVGKGSGLGLSMIHGFVKQSNGHVRISSTVGTGTTVRLYLPRSAEPSPAATAAMRPTAEQPRRGGTILAVEDNEDLRSLVLAQLRRLGYSVLEAADGVQGQRILESDQPIDLLFTDVVMPGGITGPMLAQTAKAIRPGLKILFTSGHAEHPAMRQIELDADAPVLWKPYAYAELARAVGEMIGAPAPRNTGAAREPQ